MLGAGARLVKDVGSLLDRCRTPCIIVLGKGMDLVVRTSVWRVGQKHG